MADAVVRVEDVTKRFAGHVAVRHLSMEVPRGIIFGLLGPNGAGKSTTIRMMMDIIEPDEGRVVLFGRTAKGQKLSVRLGVPAGGGRSGASGWSTSPSASYLPIICWRYYWHYPDSGEYYQAPRNP